ncbi:hypothetical protein THASP1DRAFT_27845 [Thamnocephalis sphaerospora]|uniref:Uncharacterized protein n=1 Tax=Thamnocephalis sphaerospora TaxID=78915 RepID=A0A4P9XXH6_9FUNG|nr:hypothetical protein THASP1DRAFT_27845 [Thamnocephalis sphaerospora]|eukprot:RKP10361.1 hypothetical protein THASP1DRAFT_27845 [Thamnocephalis sphaerospora]
MFFARDQRQGLLKSALATVAAALLATSAFTEIAAQTATPHGPTTPLQPGSAPLTQAQNPYGFNVQYEVAWHNKAQRQFGARFLIKLNNPVPGANWVFRFQFADNGTRVDNFWGPWSLTRLQNSWHKALPTASEDAPAIAVGDKSPRSYSFNGRYLGDDLNAMYINGYTVAVADNAGVNAVPLTAAEAKNMPLAEGLPSVPTGEFIRQQRTAANAPNSAGTTSNPAVSASAAKTDANGNVGPGGAMTGLIVCAGVLAVGLSVVGIATYRRRQDRNAFRAKQEARALERANTTKGSFRSLAAQQESLQMPEPTAINNHSAAARAAAGAVVMEDMNAEQAVAEEYYVMEDVAPDAHHYEAEPMPADGQLEEEAYYEYDAELHQPQLYMDGQDEYGVQMHDGAEYHYDDQMPQHHDEMNQQAQDYEADYVNDLPEYAVQYDDQVGYDAVDQAGYDAVDQAATGGNNAIEHVDLRPPVAQEYYVADAVAYDDEEQDLGLEPVVHNEYASHADYQAHGEVGDEYLAFEATEFEAAEFDAPADPSHQQHHLQ